MLLPALVIGPAVHFRAQFDPLPSSLRVPYSGLVKGVVKELNSAQPFPQRTAAQNQSTPSYY